MLSPAAPVILPFRLPPVTVTLSAVPPNVTLPARLPPLIVKLLVVPPRFRLPVRLPPLTMVLLVVPVELTLPTRPPPLIVKPLVVPPRFRLPVRLPAVVITEFPPVTLRAIPEAPALIVGPESRAFVPPPLAAAWIAALVPAPPVMVPPVR